MLVLVLVQRVAPTRLAAIPGVKSLVESIMPYSERHMKRVEKLQKGNPMASPLRLVPRNSFGLNLWGQAGQQFYD